MSDEKIIPSESNEAVSNIPYMVDYLKERGWEGYLSPDDWVMKSWSKDEKDKARFSLHGAYIFENDRQNRIAVVMKYIKTELKGDSRDNVFYKKLQSLIVEKFIESYEWKKRNGGVNDSNIETVAKNAAASFIDALAK